MDTKTRSTLVHLASIDQQLISHTGVNLMRWQNICSWSVILLLLHGFVLVGLVITGWPAVALLLVIFSAFLQFLVFRFARISMTMNIRTISTIKEQHDKLNTEHHTEPAIIKGKTRSPLALH